MSTIEIQAQIESLRALEELIEEAKAEAEALRDTIKQEMLNQDTEELSAGQYIVRWTSVLSQRFDTTAFKKGHARSLQGLHQAGQQQTLHHQRMKKAPCTTAGKQECIGLDHNRQGVG